MISYYGECTLAIEKVLMADCLPEPHHHKLETIRTLSESDIEKIALASAVVGSYDAGYSLFEICEENYRVIEEYYSSLAQIKGINEEEIHNILVKWDSLLLNYLSSFRSFIDHQERVLKKAHRVDVNDDRFRRFKKETSIHFDTHFSYRFIWNLRNYVQHIGFPALDLEITNPLIEKDNNENMVQISLNRDILLLNYKWKRVRRELRKQPSGIDIMYHIRTHYKSLKAIALFVAQLNIDRLGDNWEYFKKLYKEVIDLFPDASPVIVDIEVSNGEFVKFLDVSFLPLYSLVKIQDTILGTNTAFSEQ